ncbi:MAG: aminoglycoside nucleotidyltransferase [bacterium]
MKEIEEHVEAIKELFEETEKRGIMLWLENGWAIDARLCKITRAHEDIDVVYTHKQESEYKKLIQFLGYGKYEKTDYGFLTWKGNILLDSEPCFQINEEDNFKDFPKGSCPIEKQGIIRGYKVRCVSWEAMYFEFLGYIEEIPKDKWRNKDFESFRIVEEHLDEGSRHLLRDLHKKQKSNH